MNVEGKKRNKMTKKEMVGYDENDMTGIIGVYIGNVENLDK